MNGVDISVTIFIFFSAVIGIIGGILSIRSYIKDQFDKIKIMVVVMKIIIPTTIMIILFFLIPPPIPVIFELLFLLILIFYFVYKHRSIIKINDEHARHKLELFTESNFFRSKKIILAVAFITVASYALIYSSNISASLLNQLKDYHYEINKSKIIIAAFLLFFLSVFIIIYLFKIKLSFIYKRIRQFGINLAKALIIWIFASIIFDASYNLTKAHHLNFLNWWSNQNYSFIEDLSSIHIKVEELDYLRRSKDLDESSNNLELKYSLANLYYVSSRFVDFRVHKFDRQYLRKKSRLLLNEILIELEGGGDKILEIKTLTLFAPVYFFLEENNTSSVYDDMDKYFFEPAKNKINLLKTGGVFSEYSNDKELSKLEFNLNHIKVEWNLRKLKYMRDESAYEKNISILSIMKENISSDEQQLQFELDKARNTQIYWDHLLNTPKPKDSLITEALDNFKLISNTYSTKFDELLLIDKYNSYLYRLLNFLAANQKKIYDLDGSEQKIKLAMKLSKKALTASESIGDAINFVRQASMTVKYYRLTHKYYDDMDIIINEVRSLDEKVSKNLKFLNYDDQTSFLNILGKFWVHISTEKKGFYGDAIDVFNDELLIYQERWKDSLIVNEDFVLDCYEDIIGTYYKMKNHRHYRIYNPKAGCEKFISVYKKYYDRCSDKIRKYYKSKFERILSIKKELVKY